MRFLNRNMGAVKKYIAILIVVILFANMLLFGMGKLPVFLFWLIIGFGAIIAYFIFPRLK